MSVESLLTIEDGVMNNNDRTKHISINEGASEDENASDTEKRGDIRTGERNPEEDLHRLSEFSNNIIHEAKRPKEETSINLSTICIKNQLICIVGLILIFPWETRIRLTITRSLKLEL